MDNYEKVINGLRAHISADNIAKEIEYFEGELSQGFERMYGWAWLLKLSEELHDWEDPIAKELETNLKPLSELIANRVKEFLPKFFEKCPNMALDLPNYAFDYLAQCTLPRSLLFI